MGVLFEKQPVDNVVPEEKTEKAFHLYLEKFKGYVTVTSLKVNDQDDAMLDIEFDHKINAPEDEINAELGRLIIKKLEDGIASLDKNSLIVAKNEEDTQE